MKKFFKNKCDQDNLDKINTAINLSNYHDNSKYFKEHLTTLKIIVIGNSGVGKTSLITRYANNEFSDIYDPTVGYDFKNIKMTLDDNIINLVIWGTAGLERFNAVSPSFFRNAEGAIFVYDVTTESTFNNLSFWMGELNRHSNKQNIVKMVVGNKIDKKDRIVSRKEGIDWARENEALFIEASAKTNEEVKSVFEDLVENIIKTPGLWKSRHPTTVRISLDKPRKKNSCCSSKSDKI